MFQFDFVGDSLTDDEINIGKVTPQFSNMSYTLKM